MTSFVLPPRHSTTGPRKRSAYCSILTHVVRAAADAHEALELFGALVRGETAHACPALIRTSGSRRAICGRR